MDTANITPAALNVNQTLQYLAISRTTFYELVRDGEIPLVRIGGRSLVRRADADALLARSEAKTAPKRPRRRAVVTQNPNDLWG